MTRTSVALATIPNDVNAPDLDLLVDMLSYRRAEGSGSQRAFIKRFLRPVFGAPDRHNNFILTVGYDNPRIAFMAHHDTVHTTDGNQRVIIDGEGLVALPEGSKSNCLGADCTTGVWLILHMIKNKVPGRYIIHAGEEIGGVGSNAIVKDNPAWLHETDFAISFDRKGYNSIITHQYGRRTCSESFARDLSSVLGGGWKADSGGTFTDSEVYADIISECTNISVGYMNQHSKYETQCLDHAKELANLLVDAPWHELSPYRDPKHYESKSYKGGWGVYGSNSYYGSQGWRSKEDFYDDTDDIEYEERDGINGFRFYKKAKDAIAANKHRGLDYNEITSWETMEEIITRFPGDTAAYLKMLGVTRKELVEALCLYEVDY